MMELLRDMEIEMAAISEHAAQLEQMVKWPNRYTLSSTEYEWTGIKDHFNTAGALVPKLQAAADAKGWQKDVIAELASLTKAMDAQLEAGHEHLKDVTSVERLHAIEHYELRIKSIYRYAEHIDELIEYFETRNMRAS
ncbi:MAG TPA: hypothetical protein VEK15_14175 [Vicinamibacteria bacterium]|nr:hypothetical protein [Vicinamibacteria bacterium]